MLFRPSDWDYGSWGYANVFFLCRGCVWGLPLLTIIVHDSTVSVSVVSCGLPVCSWMVSGRRWQPNQPGSARCHGPAGCWQSSPAERWFHCRLFLSATQNTSRPTQCCFRPIWCRGQREDDQGGHSSLGVYKLSMQGYNMYNNVHDSKLLIKIFFFFFVAKNVAANPEQGANVC